MRAPKEGEFIRLPGHATAHGELAEKGAKMFYKGTVAEEIVKAVKGERGTLEDVKRHGEMGSEEVAPN